MNINRISKMAANRLFDIIFKNMRGRPRELMRKVLMKIDDRVLGQGDYDWLTNGENNFLRGLADLVPSGIVFDVGSHKGEWARLALSASCNWHLYCFEPNIDVFEELKHSGLPQDRSILLNFGFSDKKGCEDLIVYRHNGQISYPMSSLFLRKSMMISEPLTVEKKVPIGLTTIDEYCRTESISKITLLKIDVEGSDYRVLLGAREMLATQKIDALQFEYDASWIDSRTFLLDAYSFLQKFDYKIYKIASNGLIEINNYSPEFENFRFSNYVGLAPYHELPREQICTTF